MHQCAQAAYAQAKVVEAGCVVFGIDAGGGFLEVGGVEEQQGAEVEVVAERAELVVDYGSIALHALNHCVVVGIEHGGLGVGGDAGEAFQSAVAELQLGLLGVEQCIFSGGGGGDGFHRCRRFQVVDMDEFASAACLCGGIGAEQSDGTYESLILEAFHTCADLVLVHIGKEAMDCGLHGSIIIIYRIY